MKFLFSIFLFLFSSCGYSFIGGGSVLPLDIKNIYIENISNNTTDITISSLLHEALQDRFEKFGVVNIVDSIHDADAILSANVVSLSRDTKTSTSGTDTALQYDIKLSVSADLKRVDNGQILWKNSGLSASQTYGATSAVVLTNSADFALSSLNANDLSGMSSREVTRGQESDALEKAVEKIAKTLYDQAVAPDF